LSEWIWISEWELQCESCHDDKAHESEAPSKSGYTIREIDWIEDQHIPANGYNERNIVDDIGIRKYLELEKILIQFDDISKTSGNIGNLYARDTDDNTDEYLE
jgi:hypothetical protein